MDELQAETDEVLGQGDGEAGFPAWAWLLALLLAVGLVALLPPVTWGQQGSEDPLDDPVVRGAWLYEGNCTGCHGAYDQARVGRILKEDDLLIAIEGGSGGCQVDWGTRYDGPLRSRDLKALVAFIQAWEAAGGSLNLPPLPAQPTPTPQPTATLVDADAIPTPTPTPKPTIDPQVELAIEGSELALGAWVYTQQCYRCHLSYEQGRMARSLALDTVERTIERGKVGTSMPAFSRREGGDLRVREIRALLAYLQAWEALEAEPALPAVLFTPPTPDPADFQMVRPLEVPAIAGDVRNGARLYGQHCARCHGLQGEGGLGAILAKPWTSVRPDLTVRSTVADGIPGSPMPAWDRRHGGELDDVQIDDVVTYVLTLGSTP